LGFNTKGSTKIFGEREHAVFGFITL